MGLREKVALTATVIILTQVLFVICSPQIKIFQSSPSKQHQKKDITATYPLAVKKVQGPKIRYKKSSDKSQEALHRTFNFPDVEYPISSTPRTPFLQRPKENTPTVQYSLNSNSIQDIKYQNKKLKKLAKFKSTKSPEITNVFPEFTPVTPNPYFHTEERLFPEVEYPLSAWETWKPNYWYGSTYGLKNNFNSNDPNSYSEAQKKISKSIATKEPPTFKRSHDLSVTPSPTEMETTKTTTPFIYTPYTTLYFDTTPPYIEKATKKNKNIGATSKDIKKEEKKKTNKKKKPTKKEMESLVHENKCPLCADFGNSTPSRLSYIISPEETLLTKTPDSFVTLRTDEPILQGNFSEFETCSKIGNETLLFEYVPTTLPSCLSCNDATHASPFTIHSDDKTPTVSCDSESASISVILDAVTSENGDNSDSRFEDNVKNSNNSSTFDVDEEFTTDFPDFDESILPWNTMSTSTMSPMSVADDVQDWANAAVIDPLKSVAYHDELEECYIQVL